MEEAIVTGFAVLISFALIAIGYWQYRPLLLLGSASLIYVSLSKIIPMDYGLGIITTGVGLTIFFITIFEMLTNAGRRRR